MAKRLKKDKCVDDILSGLRKQLEEEYKFTIRDLKEQVRQTSVHNESLRNENQELHLRIRELRKQLEREQLKEREIKKKDYTIHNLQCDIEELRNESRRLRKSFSFRFGWTLTAPFRIAYEFSRRKKIIVYVKGAMLFATKPFFMLSSLNRRNFKVLLYAIKTEPPGQIISNMKKMMKDPKKASKEATKELQNCPGTHTAGRSAIDLAIAENADTHVFLDDCTVMENRVQISGWALSKHGVKTIEVFLNGEFLGSARHGQRRPDLKKVFPGIKNAENSGFTFNRIHQPGTSAENAGKIEVIVRVTDKKNGKSQISKKVPLLKNDINLIKPDKITLDEDIKILTNQKAIELTDVSVSVVIPTKNAGPEFDNLLKTLIGQKGFKEIEVIIVDSGSTDKTIEAAKHHGVNVVGIKPEEFTHSYARNLGAEQAKNDFLFFTVQDAMPSSLYFLYLMHYRLKREGVEVVTCTETPRADSDLFYRVTNRNHYRFLDVINQDKLFSYPGTDDHITLRKNAQLSDIGLLIKRELFMKYKYRLDYGEDLDLGMRLVKDGHTLLYAGTVKIIHSHKRVPYYYLRRGLVDSLYLKIRFKDFQYPNVKLEDVILEIPALYNELIHIIENKLEKLDDFTNHEQLDCTQELEAFQYKPAVRTTMLRKSEIVDDETYDFISELNEKAGQIDAENYNSNKVVVAGMINYSHILNTYMLDHYSRMSNETIREYANALIRIFALLTGAYMGYCYLNDSDNPAAIEIYKKLKMNV
ncbi:MAG: glycosyltransferase [Bacteroidales bacterium]|nr:glycosyltransferase [Bacteroidales bacterium]MCF8350616.1 glycosyltransferase [Bacteroidales bacterium]MCF8377151.1 glycosyltransferase [Bacteroidales bacterium]